MKVEAVDLNLLVVLDAVLGEGSVTRAAQQLNRSVPAVSRALGRLRATLGDPLMVRSGRGLQPTAAAVDLKPRVRAFVEQAQALFDGDELELRALTRTFTVLAPPDVIISKGVDLLNGAVKQAPNVQFRFLAADRGLDEADALRDGAAELAISVNASKHADLRSAGLIRVGLTAAVRAGHDLASEHVTPQRFAAWPHVMISRRGRVSSALDRALAETGHPRTVACTVPDFITSLHLVSASDLITIAPANLVTQLQAQLRLTQIEIPIMLKPLRVSQLWHPRHHDDPAHRWLRHHITELADESHTPADSRPH